MSDKSKNILRVAIFLVALAFFVLILNIPVANGEEISETIPVITIEKVFDITPYLVGFLSLLTLFISTWLVPMLKSKTTAEQQEIIQAMANIVVYAAEQLFKGTGLGQQKLAYALEHLQERLHKYGIKIDNEALRPYIEAAVKALNLKQDYLWVDDEPVEDLAKFLASGDKGNE